MCGDGSWVVSLKNEWMNCRPVFIGSERIFHMGDMCDLTCYIFSDFNWSFHVKDWNFFYHDLQKKFTSPWWYKHTHLDIVVTTEIKFEQHNIYTMDFMDHWWIVILNSKNTAWLSNSTWSFLSVLFCFYLISSNFQLRKLKLSVGKNLSSTVYLQSHSPNMSISLALCLGAYLFVP